MMSLPVGQMITTSRSVVSDPGLEAASRAYNTTDIGIGTDGDPSQSTEAAAPFRSDSLLPAPSSTSTVSQAGSCENSAP